MPPVAVKYQFGDIDGSWAAALQPHRGTPRRVCSCHHDSTASLRQRVAAIIDLLYDGLTCRATSRAIENLRAALPRDPAELERLYPKTAAELSSWGQGWLQTCQQAFAGLGVDPERVREVAASHPRRHAGITSERQLGSFIDLDVARRGLTNAIVTYLEESRLRPSDHQ